MMKATTFKKKKDTMNAPSKLSALLQPVDILT
jgi:hypothetical protein